MGITQNSFTKGFTCQHCRYMFWVRFVEAGDITDRESEIIYTCPLCRRDNRIQLPDGVVTEEMIKSK